MQAKLNGCNKVLYNRTVKENLVNLHFHFEDLSTRYFKTITTRRPHAWGYHKALKMQNPALQAKSIS